MNQKLFLHIGMGKTGTTAIQHFCENNESILKQHNVVYCPYRIYEYWPRVEEPYDKAIKYIDKQLGRGKDILVSDECIYLKYADDPYNIHIQKRFPNLDIKVIIYLRRQDLHLESLVNFLQLSPLAEDGLQWIDFPAKFKDPYPGITAESYDYYHWLEPLAETLGKDNIILRLYEPDRFKGGTIFSDFLDALGVPFSDEFIVAKRRANQSLDSRFARLLKDFYRQYPTKHGYERRIMSQAFLAVNNSMGVSRKRTLFSMKEREQFIEYFGKGNALLAKAFFGEDSLLFDMTFPDKGDDKFEKGELEILPSVLNKVWYETLAGMGFGAFNTFKMRMYQDRFHSGDNSARKKYLFHKIINSIGKRFSKDFFTPIEWSLLDMKKKQ